MTYTLIIAEKPSASKSIAEALADGKPVKMQEEGSRAYWFEFERDGSRFVCAPAVGHLFTLKQQSKGWDYPAFDVDWVPSFKASKGALFSQPYYLNIEKLAKDAGDVIIATDYDDEGEVIGVNILRFLLGRKDAARMKFSTMTKEELLDSYAHTTTINKNLVESGYTRHYLDYMWGISLTRALTNAIKAAQKRFRILSTGRVQGPVLHLLGKHEKKIKAFKPKPFWEIDMTVRIGKQQFTAVYHEDKLWDKKEADSILKKASAKSASVSDIRKKLMTQKPPVPYNTTAFLTDIYRYFGYAPQQGLNIAESLYQAGLISYPRTNSQQLPKDINYKKILTSLGKQGTYAKDAAFLLSRKELTPMQGKATSAAHPAIYPTGETPKKKMTSMQQRVYDLVVRRFLAVFGDPAKRESQTVVLTANGEQFMLRGTKTIEAGWTLLYGKYAARDEITLPVLKQGDTLAIDKVNQTEKETQPPARYSQGSVLKAMEQAGLGTQATRAQILQILYNRGYIIGKSIEVTDLGMQLADILERNIAPVVSERLTRHFEEECDGVEKGTTKRGDVIEEAKKELTKICNEFRKKEKKIGEELTSAVIATQDKQSILGTCKSCGGTLKVHKLWRTGKRFVGCTGYKKGCRTGYPLPREGLIISQEKECASCKTPIIQVYQQGRRPFRMCLDPLCETKKDWLDKSKLKKAQQESMRAKKAAEKLVCASCGKPFASKRALSLHAKTHSGAVKAVAASSKS
ncbi:MAG: DNA topoisomerase I [Candidatus Aenigmarchaeota archaeon]|nr:DNA topoisomerase I [Candidatus Aenigmarchaeota archaeon]